MKRKLTHQPLLSCKRGYEKESIHIWIDNSGSCDDWAEMFQSISKIVANLDNCDLYIAPNCDLYSKYNRKTQKFEEFKFSPEFFKNKTIMFFGDFDGASILCYLSTIAKVYWFSNENRYNDFYEHSWNQGYSFTDFKGDYIPAKSERDLIRQLRKFKFVEIFSPKINQQRHLKSMEKGERYEY